MSLKLNYFGHILCHASLEKRHDAGAALRKENKAVSVNWLDDIIEWAQLLLQLGWLAERRNALRRLVCS